MEKNVGIERILLIMKHFNLSQRQFALRTGMNPQTFNSMVIRDYELRLSVIASILHAFPDVRTEWFVMGEGEMLRPEKTDEELLGEKIIPVLKKQIAHLESEIDYLREQNMLLLRGTGYEKGKVAV